MSLIDRAIEAVAPAWAGRRYAARAQIAMARESGAIGGAGGASRGRLEAGWQQSTSTRGGRAADRYDLARMRDRARRVYDENEIGSGLLDTETDNVVSEGFALQCRSSSTAWNDEAEARYYEWLDRADVSGMMCASDLFRASWREPRKDGDGGFLKVLQAGRPMLQYVPGDWIASPLGPRPGPPDTVPFDLRRTYSGVQCDRAGRPVQFWLRDVDETGWRFASVPVPASDFVYLTPRRSGTLAARGETVYRRIFHRLDQLDTYVDSVTKAAIMACIFGLIEKRRNPSAVVGGLGTQPNVGGEQQKAVTLENGMLKVLGTDEGVFQVQAGQPMQQTPDFIRALFRIACLAFDMPIEIGQKDLSQVNFSGGRIGLIGYYRSCRVKQDWLKSRCWNPITRWWLDVEHERQRLGFADAFRTPFPADYHRFELFGREWEYNDPVTEAQADLLEISMGIKSPQMAANERGRDHATIQAEIKGARERSVADGIPLVLSALTRDPKTPAEPTPAVMTAATAATPPAMPPV